MITRVWRVEQPRPRDHRAMRPGRSGIERVEGAGAGTVIGIGIGTGIGSGLVGARTGSPAPALDVTGVEPGGVSLSDLTARGAALLVFVFEECPTSAMALRNLGPLCRGLEQAGLAGTGPFPDSPDLGICEGRQACL